MSKQLVTIPDCDIVRHSYNSVIDFVLLRFEAVLSVDTKIFVASIVTH